MRLALLRNVARFDPGFPLHLAWKTELSAFRVTAKMARFDLF